MTFPGQWSEPSSSDYPAYISKLTPVEAAFERWWYDEGSGMGPENGDDRERHLYRVTRVAWMKGAYKAVADKVPLEAL